MVRRFLRDSAIYVVPAAISSGISFILFPLYAHHFTPREYGILDLLLLTGTLVGVTVALEVYQAVGRYVTGEPDLELRRAYASTGLLITLVMYTVFGLVVLTFATPITHVLLGPGVDPALVQIAMAWMWVQGMLSFTQAQLRWQMRPGAFATASALNGVFTALPAAVFVLVLHMEVRGALLGQLVGSAVALAYVMVMTKGTFRLRFDLAKCRQLLHYSLPLVPSGAGVFLNLYADRLVIQHVRSVADVGLYGVAYRIAMIGTLLLVGVQGALTPLILSRREDPSTPADVARIFRIFAALALSVFVALSVLATPLLRVLAAAPYQTAYSVVPFLVASTLFAGMYIFAPGLVIAKKTITMAKLTVSAGVANLILALALVPPLGIEGAGLATAVTSLAWFVALIRASNQYYVVPHRWHRLVAALVSVVALVTVAMITLPAGRVGALSPSTLAVRGTVIVIGVGLSVWLSLTSEDLRLVLGGFASATRRVAGVRNRKIRQSERVRQRA
jgi:O-antigen/teichoic acid export membrane protein